MKKQLSAKKGYQMRRKSQRTKKVGKKRKYPFPSKYLHSYYKPRLTVMNL